MTKLDKKKLRCKKKIQIAKKNFRRHYARTPLDYVKKIFWQALDYVKKIFQPPKYNPNGASAPAELHKHTPEIAPKPASDS